MIFQQKSVMTGSENDFINILDEKCLLRHPELLFENHEDTHIYQHNNLALVL